MTQPATLKTESDAQDWIQWALIAVAEQKITLDQVSCICALVGSWSNLRRDSASIDITKDAVNRRQPPKEPWEN